ncbi:MAG: hypothetical protein E7551_04490 [Ruminococcaceae bacterium]|nr:hypothetical protein [Oscillospiraceae bacterium]
MNNIENHFMINNGLKEMAANAVELVVDERTGIAYAVYLSSESAFGESSELVTLARFNILQPTNVEWTTVFNRELDFDGDSLSECNIIELNSEIVRVYAVNLKTLTYYYKDINKKTLAISKMKELKFKISASAQPITLNKENINNYIFSIGGEPFSHLQITTNIIKVDGFYYTTVCGGNKISNFLFMKSADGETWSFVSLVKHIVNYEAMLAYYNNKFWVICRNGEEIPTTKKQQNLLYSDDGVSWTESNLSLETSDTRPYLFNYQDNLYLAYSSPMPNDFSTIRPWRCNVHIGRIVSKNGVEDFEEIVYKESKFGIVYYALKDWYGKMIMLYSSGELHPAEGLMGGWSQGKDCLNYAVLYEQAPILMFKK